MKIEIVEISTGIVMHTIHNVIDISPDKSLTGNVISTAEGQTVLLPTHHSRLLRLSGKAGEPDS